MVFAKWLSQKFHFDLPLEAKLGQFRSLIAQHTGLPEDAFKLIHAGGIMKDNNLPLSAYKIRPTTSVTVIGSTEKDLPPQPHIPLHPIQESTISSIQTELNSVRSSLLPSLDALVSSLENNSGDPPTNEKEYKRLDELLLQALLRLDAIPTDGEWEDARKERKTAVKEVQSLLDRLDAAWRSRVPS